MKQEKQVMKCFQKNFDKLVRRNEAPTVWADFLLVSACAISNQVDQRHAQHRETMYARTIKKYSEEERFLIKKLYDLTDVGYFFKLVSGI